MKTLVRILLGFSQKLVEKPITAEVVLQHGVPISIVAAHIDSQGGEILAEVPATHVEKVIDTFREKGVTVTLPELVHVDSDECFDCGACVSLCPVSAIAFKADSSVAFDETKCIGSPCGICVDACPARAIRLDEQRSSGFHSKR